MATPLRNPIVATERAVMEPVDARGRSTHVTTAHSTARVEPVTLRAGDSAPHPPRSGMDLHIRQLSKRYRDVAALDAVDLDIASGELVALLGPSGSGKTTLLRVIAGLLHPDAGTLHFGQTDATSMRLRQRNVGFVFQQYALFRHMTVKDNIAFGLRSRPRRHRPPRRPGSRTPPAGS